MSKLLLKLKLFIVSLVNLGGFPVLIFSLFDLGYIYSNYSELIWLIVFAELIFGTLLLMSIVFAENSTKKTSDPLRCVNSANPHIIINQECTN